MPNIFEDLDATAAVPPADNIFAQIDAPQPDRPRPPIYAPDGHALTPDEVAALYAPRPAAPESSIPEKIALAIQRTNEDPIGAFSESVGTIAGRLGVPNSEALGRDIYAGIQSLGPLGAEFAPFGARPIPIAPKTGLPGAAPALAASEAALPREALQSRLNALPAENIFAKLEKAAPAEEPFAPPKFAGNINLNRIQSPDDVKAAIKATAAQHEGFPDARRGTMTFEQIRELAPLTGMTADKLASRGIGKTFNAEEMFAARRLLVSQAEEVANLARTAYSSGAHADKFAALQSITRLVATQEQVAGATAEAGRLLGQFRMMADAGKSADAIKRILDTGGGRVDDILEGIAKLGDAPPEAIAGFVKNAWAAKTSDLLQEAWINALLSGPQTHATNILSNSLVALWQLPEALTSATISKFTGSGIPYREVTSRAIGLVEGVKEGLRSGLKAFITEEPSDFTAKIEQSKYRAIPSLTFRAGKQRKEIGGVPIPLTGEIQVGGRQVRVPGRALMAADEFFKAMNYRAELNAQAVRQALAEGKRGEELARRVVAIKDAPSEELLRKARDAAEKATFTNPLGDFGRSLQTMTAKHPALKVIIPFVRTPVNIVKYAAERGPLAPLFKEVRQNLKGANGAQARDEQIAKISLGSAVGAATAAYAAEGVITGGGPTDPKARAALYATGWQPYSIKIGNTYYSFGRLEPLGTLLGTAADFVQLAEAMTETQKVSLVALITGSISKNLVSKTWLRGLSDALEAFNDPDRYGARWIQSLFGTLVPTGVAQIARTDDPYLREARTILDTIKSRLPGYRETLPMRRDIFGEPIKLEGSLGPDLISPIYTSTDTGDPVAHELVRLGMAPSRATRQIMGVDLESPEYGDYQVNAGQIVRQMLAEVINEPAYAALSDEAKRDLIESVMRKSREVGRGLTVQQHPDIVSRAAAAKQQKASKLMGAP